MGLFKNRKKHNSPALENNPSKTQHNADDTAYEAWLDSYQNHHLDFDTWKSMAPVSYTHLDVYKRQI